ncbi:MAG: PSD1 and planctomycete cytochrome C domain-containing protein [Gemmataceae bacterium]
MPIIIRSLALVLILFPGPRLQAADAKVDFRRDIEPILKARCVECHGAEKRKGGLLLTRRNDALLPSDSGKPALVPGDSEKSELLRRILSTERREQMPPRGDRLKPEEAKLLRAWIDQGADWPAEKIAIHWAYVPPQAGKAPAVKQADWVKNPIDAFVLARLEAEGLRPSPELDRARLIRRVYLDLIGLPPPLEAVEAFVNDTRPGAYERVVDKLLASPQYGERWARHWLDLARYADSNGFQRDGFRTVWPYRDWVVQAFNDDMPYDRFTVEQLAGDLLPDATTAQKIATGFHRCTTVNVEAGVDPEENRVNTIIDRVNTTATVWLGTTLACAQCHNHKYDPFTQQDYYRVFAYFNNTPIETTTAENARLEFIGPRMEMPRPAENEARYQLLGVLHQNFDGKLRERAAELAKKQPAWEKASKDSKDLPENIRNLLALNPLQRKENQKKLLAEYFYSLDKEYQQTKKDLEDVEKQQQEMEPATTLVMVEQQQRDTFVFRRGIFLNKGKQVAPGVPASLPGLPADARTDRLGLARWLASKDNPLVARVAVNRWWAELFGHGIVLTLEDFGTQGAKPTHPELLDWLAGEFVAQGWSMKKIHRLIVTSATYRQTSRVTRELLQRDPENLLYARGPRFRLPAEAIRDNALAAAGLLSLKQGGPPVFPPQPAGLWNVIGKVDNTYRTSDGEDRYRRGIYTIWRRSAPYPSFVAFDAPDRSSCVVARPRTNTPLQALTLMNDPVFVEVAKALADRVLSERQDAALQDRIRHAFRLCLSRSPTEQEIAILEKLYQTERAIYAEKPASAKLVLGKWFDSARTRDPIELAAWFKLASVLLNLDEMITKG